MLRDCLPSMPLAAEICAFHNRILIAAIGQSVGLSPTLPHVGVRVLVNGRPWLPRRSWAVSIGWAPNCAPRVLKASETFPHCRCDCRLAGNRHPMFNTTGTSETCCFNFLSTRVSSYADPSAHLNARSYSTLMKFRIILTSHQQLDTSMALATHQPMCCCPFFVTAHIIRSTYSNIRRYAPNTAGCFDRCLAHGTTVCWPVRLRQLLFDRSTAARPQPIRGRHVGSCLIRHRKASSQGPAPRHTTMQHSRPA